MGDIPAEELKIFNDPILVNWKKGGIPSLPILVIGTEGLGGFPVAAVGATDKNEASKNLLNVFNGFIKQNGGDEELETLEGKVAICNVVRPENATPPLNVSPGDYKNNQTFGDVGEGGVDPGKEDEIYGKIKDNAAFIIKKLNEGKHVLVHCNAGASRSPSVVALALMMMNGITLDEAVEEIKKKAPKNSEGKDRVYIGAFSELIQKIYTSNLPAHDPRFEPTPEPEPTPAPITEPASDPAKKAVSKLKPGAKDSKTYIAPSRLLVRIKKKLKQAGGSIKTKRKKRRKSKKRTKRRKSKKRTRHKRR